MRLTHFFPSIFALASGLSVYGQTVREHPIEVELERCLQDSSVQTTKGMQECHYTAMTAWDAEMNKTYADLMKALAPASQIALQQAQRVWLDYRDRQFALNDEAYLNELNGTMYQVMASCSNMDLVKRRAEDLKHMLEIMVLK